MNKLCKTCGALCCKYFALEIDRPTTRGDLENIRWYLSHHKVAIFIQEKGWYLKVGNRCKHLAGNGRCKVYDERPAICRKHNVLECEYHYRSAVREIRTLKQLERYLQENPVRRKGKK